MKFSIGALLCSIIGTFLVAISDSAIFDKRSCGLEDFLFSTVYILTAFIGLIAGIVFLIIGILGVKDLGSKY